MILMYTAIKNNFEQNGLVLNYFVLNYN